MSTDKLKEEIYDDLKKLVAYTAEKTREEIKGSASIRHSMYSKTLDQKLKLLELCLLDEESKCCS